MAAEATRGVHLGADGLDGASAGGPILVVDDDGALRDTLRVLLERAGYAVVCAENGREALDYLRTGTPPVLILLDLQMPVMNGEAFRAEQLEVPGLDAIPVVVFSAHPRGEATARSLGLPCLRKPAGVGQVLEIVKRYCEPA